MMMISRIILFNNLILLCLSMDEDISCNYRLKYLNGSESWCKSDECSLNHVDIYSLENDHCETNYLSLRYSSYSRYREFLLSTYRKKSVSSYFISSHPNVERLYQLELISPLESNLPFQSTELNLLSNSPISNIDTLEMIFDGNLSKENLIIGIDLNHSEEISIDTLRLIFTCQSNERVEWELIRSVGQYPPSPCPKQINYLHLIDAEKNEDYFHINIFVSQFGEGKGMKLVLLV